VPLSVVTVKATEDASTGLDSTALIAVPVGTLVDPAAGVWFVAMSGLVSDVLNTASTE
jgi:hypothetical protein